MTGDPNALKLTPADVAGVPSLNDGEGWVLDNVGFSTVKLEHLEKRCEFWRKVAPKVPI
jgi:hypothetical protein